MIRSDERPRHPPLAQAEGGAAFDAGPAGIEAGFLARRRGALVAIPDRALLEMARGGHEPAFGALVDRHREGVLRMACRYAGDRSEAMDISQEVFLALHRKLPTWDDGVAVQAWLHGVARNKGLERTRKLASTRRIESESARMRRVPDARPQEPGPAHGDGTRLQEAVRRLSDRQRQVISRHFLQGFPLASAAKSLGISINNAKVTVKRGLRTLRRLLAQESSGS